MPVVDAVTAGELGHAYAEAVRDEPAAKRLWVRANGDEVELWLLVAEAIDSEIELRLYEADLRVYDRFPDTAAFIHVVNPRHYPHFDPGEVIPADAEEIVLHLRSDGATHARAPRKSRA